MVCSLNKCESTVAESPPSQLRDGGDLLFRVHASAFGRCAEGVLFQYSAGMQVGGRAEDAVAANDWISVDKERIWNSKLAGMLTTSGGNVAARARRMAESR